MKQMHQGGVGIGVDWNGDTPTKNTLPFHQNRFSNICGVMFNLCVCVMCFFVPMHSVTLLLHCTPCLPWVAQAMAKRKIYFFSYLLTCDHPHHNMIIGITTSTLSSMSRSTLKNQNIASCSVVDIDATT